MDKQNEMAKAYERLHRKDTDEIVDYAYGLEQQLQSYKDREDKLREYISKNVFVGQELIHKEDTKNGFIAEVKSHLFKIIPTNKDFITNILQILNEGSDK